jgi:hypothetical protein
MLSKGKKALRPGFHAFIALLFSLLLLLLATSILSDLILLKKRRLEMAPDAEQRESG